MAQWSTIQLMRQGLGQSVVCTELVRASGLDLIQWSTIQLMGKGLGQSVGCAELVSATVLDLVYTSRLGKVMAVSLTAASLGHIIDTKTSTAVTCQRSVYV